jgi:1-acyl-sn-glycerol-3-phosphate acyltransferase
MQGGRLAVRPGDERQQETEASTASGPLPEAGPSGLMRLRQVRPEPYTLLDGLVATPSRRTQIRAAVGLGFWLGAPLQIIATLGRAGRRSEMHALSRWWARGVARHLGLRVQLGGLDGIVPGEPYIVAALHEGFVDAVALLLLPLDQRFVARDELFTWPMWGQLLRDTGQLEVQPESGMLGYLQLRRQAPAVVARGESVTVFPQGSILGLEIDFRGGLFALAHALGRPILPVALTGTHRVWEHPYTPRLRYGQRISLHVLPPISAAEVRALGVEGARQEVQRRLKTAALHPSMAPVRRYVPARDGYWDGYAFEIDPAFPALAADIARRRAAHAAGQIQT